MNTLIRAARAGDDAAARALVGYLAECLEGGKAPPGDLARYFAPALKRIASGRSADVELNLGKHSNWGKHYEIAEAVWKLNHRAVDRLPLRDSSKKTGAYSVVGAQYHMGADRVEQIYRAMRALVEAEFLDDLPSTDAEARHHREIQQNLLATKLAHVLEKRGRK